MAGLAAALSCTKSEDTEPYIPSQSGATQPEAGGPVLGEGAACERVRGAEADARDRLGCAAATDTDCPAAVRPAGGAACYEYSARSVEGCEAAFAAAESCSAFPLCIVTAVLNEKLTSCPAPSAEGSAGAANAAGGAVGTSEGGAGGAAMGGSAAGAAADGGAAPVESAGAGGA